MSFGRRISLWTMMLLQYGIWGSWSVVAGKYMSDPKPVGLDLQGTQQGILFSLLPLATIFVPMFTGQIADRIMNAERLMGILHIFGGVAMTMLAKQTDYGGTFLWMLVFSIAYAPTLSLSNSITFAHLSDSAKQFGPIRVAGTIGWILAGWTLSAWRVSGNAPAGDLFVLAAYLSFALGILAFFLPKTPPAKTSSKPFAFLEAFALFKQRDFFVFMLVAFVVGTELEFYYLHTSSFLGSPKQYGGLSIPRSQIASIMSIAQIAEIAVMLSLPFFLKRLGVRRTIVLGIIAWPVRYAIFAFLPQSGLVVPALALHGFCFVFFFVVGFIYVDKLAPKEIRASAQALVALVVIGLGRYVGSLFAGYVQAANTRSVPKHIVDTIEVTQIVDWPAVFTVPCVLTVICAIFFPLMFKGYNSIELGRASTVAPKRPA